MTYARASAAGGLLMLLGVWMMTRDTASGLTWEDALAIVTLLLGIVVALLAPDIIDRFRRKGGDE